MKVEQVLKRVSGLNPDAGEIGPGMLRTIVQEATEALVELATMNERIRELEASLIKAKGIPMKYKRMEFNAQLQDENSSLRTALAAEREVLLAEQALSDKLEKALNSFEISGPDGDGVLWLKIRAKDTGASGMLRIGKVGLIVAQVALHIRTDMSTALAEVEAIRAKQK